jgi:hypothetical protein
MVHTIFVLAISSFRSTAPAVAIRDDAHECVSCAGDVPLLEAQDRGPELSIAKELLDPAPKVAASEMALYDPVGERGEHSEELSNRSSALACLPAVLCEHELPLMTDRNLAVLLAMTHVRRQARNDAEPFQRIARSRASRIAEATSGSIVSFTAIVPSKSRARVRGFTLQMSPPRSLVLLRLSGCRRATAANPPAPMASANAMAQR